jgi:hypothetical protein
MFRVCFAAETPMRTEFGSVRADQVTVGMRLLSRVEYNMEGVVESKEVEQVFVREGLIWHLTVRGELIRSTAEHPFFVQGQGWTPLNQIKAGDQIWTEVSGWVSVEAVEQTGKWETVYNFRIEDYHTYFVGTLEWGFSLWAHNLYLLTDTEPELGAPSRSQAAMESLRARLAAEGLTNLNDQEVIHIMAQTAAGEGGIVTDRHIAKAIRETFSTGTSTPVDPQLIAAVRGWMHESHQFNVTWQSPTSTAQTGTGLTFTFRTGGGENRPVAWYFAQGPADPTAATPRSSGTRGPRYDTDTVNMELDPTRPGELLRKGHIPAVGDGLERNLLEDSTAAWVGMSLRVNEDVVGHSGMRDFERWKVNNPGELFHAVRLVDNPTGAGGHQWVEWTWTLYAGPGVEPQVTTVTFNPRSANTASWPPNWFGRHGSVWG